MPSMRFFRNTWNGTAPPRGGQALRQAGTVVAPLAALFLDALFPPHCMACRAAIQTSRGLCADCWSKMRFIERPYCERLGSPFDRDLGSALLSPAAVAHPPAFGRARAVACFDDGPVRHLIHQLKYADRPDYARVLGRWMARAGAEVLAEADVLVPVPLHAGRLWRRRYNQAALLAQAVGAEAHKPVSLDALVRVKPTRSQVGMTRNERAENIQGAFQVKAERNTLRGRRAVLIDDVLTTGATLNAAARVLLRNGAAQVDALVFAQVVTTP